MRDIKEPEASQGSGTFESWAAEVAILACGYHEPRDNAFGDTYVCRTRIRTREPDGNRETVIFQIEIRQAATHYVHIVSLLVLCVYKG